MKRWTADELLREWLEEAKANGRTGEGLKFGPYARQRAEAEARVLNLCARSLKTDNKTDKPPDRA